MVSKKVVDLFCGAGGLSHGFEKDNFYNTIIGVDSWEDALETYRYNNPTVGLQMDIASEEPSKVPVDPHQVDIVVGGPPCKGFSLAGQREEDDERNQLVKSFINYVEYFEPEVAVMENVVGILSMSLPGYSNGDVIDYIYERYETAGYNIRHKTLHANNYGIPQTRSRVFFIAVKEDIGEPSFPDETTPDTTQKCGEVLDQNFDNYQNHNRTNHSDDMVERIADVEYGDSLYDNYSEAWKRVDPTEPAPTIKENHGAPFIHPYEDRVGTPRECAAIQSFPNNYIFKGSKSSCLKQIGNAVPPRLSEVIVDEITSIY
jgi:DNA (cytosine-5)-methyltransferase 1